jgi:hypothetical protein
MARKARRTTNSRTNEKPVRTTRRSRYIGENSSDEEDSMQVDQQTTDARTSQPSARLLNTRRLNDSNESNDSSENNGVPSSSKSLVWNYAARSESGKAKCLKCNKEISYKDYSTTSLRRHLHTCQNLPIFASKRNTNGVQASIDTASKQKLNELVYKCIIRDGRSFGDLRKPGMARLLQEAIPGTYNQVLSPTLYTDMAV